MNVVLIMLPVAIGLAALAVFGFILSARRGQFDDLDTPPLRVVTDEGDEPAGVGGLEAPGPPTGT